MGRYPRIKVRGPKPIKRNPLIRDYINEDRPLGTQMIDPFFDCYKEELLTLNDIMDLIGLHDRKFITITFDKMFLKKIVKSHIKHIRTLNAD